MSPKLPKTGEVGSEAGDGRTQFATTHWSLVLRASQPDAVGSGAALEKLCRAYWFPLYAFARREGWGPDDAKDLTQEFFSRLLAKEYLKMADPNRGKFRSFLLAAFKHMIANERRAASRQKRGGDAVVFSLDDDEAEERYARELPDTTTPETIFERHWAEATLARVLDRLESDYSGQTIRFDELKTFLIDAKGTAPFAEVAARLGVTEAALKSLVHRMRRRYAELFRDEVAQTLADPADVQDEIRHMLAVLGG